MNDTGKNVATKMIRSEKMFPARALKTFVFVLRDGNVIVYNQICKYRCKNKNANYYEAGKCGFIFFENFYPHL